MAKTTYYAVTCRGKVVQHKDDLGRKMPLIFISRRQAEYEAEDRTIELKKPNTVKAVTLA